MAQSRGKELIDRLPDVYLVLARKSFIARGITSTKFSKAGATKSDTAARARSEGTIKEHLLNGRQGEVRYCVRQHQQGCNQYCTFCICPIRAVKKRSRDS